MNSKNKNLYIAWVPFQRRAQTLAAVFGLKTCYHYFKGEEKNRLFKIFSYFGKSIATLRDLIRYKPEYVFIQLSPTPLLYTVALYCAFTRCRYISDCHNTMLYDSIMIHLPFAEYLLRKSHVLIVHNKDVQAHADRLCLPSVILRDPLPIIKVPEDISQVSGISLDKESYVIVPGSMDTDEPLLELFDAAKEVSGVLFVLTWFVEKLPTELRTRIPDNMRFTGFLDEPEFNALYANANAALVLTTREGTQPSGASEAISLGVPLIISEIKTTRRLYDKHPVYVTNDAASIAEGVRVALADYEKWSGMILDLRDGLADEADTQITAIKKLL